ncbi:MAG: hypothetical protein LBE12_02900 [Planctomycetaceae bacterium]|nr:hypothetical protein [Planctomycetaceae bacterium]
MQDRITAKEYQSWQRYKMVYGPFGYEREDYNTASIVRAIFELGNIIIAVNTGKASCEYPTLENCMLRFKRIVDEMPMENQVENQEIDNVKALLRKYGKRGK